MAGFGGFGGFGGGAAASSGGFGGFGAASSAAAGFGGFGAAASSSATGFGGGFGGGFGAASSGAAGFGGFGAASSGAGGGFGGFGAASSASGFGGFGAAAGGFGGFGAASSASGFGGFGATSSASTGFGGFGAAPSSGGGFGGFGGFGAAQSSGGFGGFGGFGAGATGMGGGAFAQQQARPNADPFAAALLACQNDFDVFPKFYSLWRQYFERSPSCFCMAFLYTLVPESQVAVMWEHMRNKYQEEQYNITEAQWSQAKRENPDPTRFLPCPVRSIRELAERNEKQVLQISRFEAEKKHLTNQLQEMKRAFNEQEPGSLDRKTRDVMLRVGRIRSRLLEIIAKLERARPARTAVARDQRVLEDKLQRVDAKATEYTQNLYEADAVLSAYDHGNQQAITSTMLPAETTHSMLAFLNHQQKALQSLGQMVSMCKEDLEIVSTPNANPPRVSGLSSATGSFVPSRW
ncbi:putative nucleoporin Nup54 [Diplonema papillatum]|nr:putative nucleoporin Nup54 [Diplonema papillatum]